MNLSINNLFHERSGVESNGNKNFTLRQAHRIKFLLKARHIIYVSLLLLGASFLGYFWSLANSIGFLFFGLLGLVLGLWRREYLLYIIILELTLGSFGYLLSWEADGLHLPLRILLFIVVMGLWFYDVIKLKVKNMPSSVIGGQKSKAKELPHYKLLSSQSRIVLSLVLFLFIWILGIVEGYLRGNLPSNIFFDANSYVYLLLILPALKYINTKEMLNEMLKVVLWGALIFGFFTFGLFIIFIYSPNIYFLEILYKWVRDLRIGEITLLQNGAYRIFLQSQFFFLPILLLFFIVSFYKKKIKALHGFATIILSGALYISLSRSFWVGAFVGFATCVILFFILKNSAKHILKHSAKFFALCLIGILFSIIIAPKDGSILKNRLKIGESALNSRVSQLAPLLSSIKASPLTGYGFGKTLTFKSFDPRVTYVLKNGEYTTYAFEWGYLDMILKFGIIGLLALFYLLWTIIYLLLKKVKKEPLALWSLSSLITLLAVHIFTPYLNHPIGIGLLVIITLIANKKYV